VRRKGFASLIILILLVLVFIYISLFFLFPGTTPIIKTDWWINNRYCEKICDMFNGGTGSTLLNNRSKCTDFVSCEQEMLPIIKHNRVEICFSKVNNSKTYFQCPFTYQKGIQNP
jgi:hypothetical protein